MDRVVVALLGACALIETLLRLGHPVVPGLAILLCVAAVATTVPLVLRWPAPIAVVASGELSLAFLDRLTLAGVAAQLLAAWAVGRRGSLAVAAVASVGYLPLAVSSVSGLGHPTLAFIDSRVLAVLLAAVMPAAALAGAARRAHLAELDGRAERQAYEGSLVEHTARGERTRIARELHDVVAHHVSMVVVQADNARLTTPGMPSLGAERLAAIGTTARAALIEMRRLLGVLRTGGEAADRQPQPGLRQLTDLLDEARDSSGAGTRLIVSGVPGGLDPGTELAAYRIVQEALTNARRHAPGAAVDVELHYAATELRLSIRDNGPGPPTAAASGGHGLLGMRERATAIGGTLHSGPASTGGHGLLGMRERATAVGGTLHSGPASTGGFLVEATLPLHTEEFIPLRPTPPAPLPASPAAPASASASPPGSALPPASVTLPAPQSPPLPASPSAPASPLAPASSLASALALAPASPPGSALPPASVTLPAPQSPPLPASPSAPASPLAPASALASPPEPEPDPASAFASSSASGSSAGPGLVLGGGESVRRATGERTGSSAEDSGSVAGEAGLSLHSEETL